MRLGVLRQSAKKRSARVLQQRHSVPRPSRAPAGAGYSSKAVLPHHQVRKALAQQDRTAGVVMTVDGKPVALDPARDSLINVNALGMPTPSARFTSGREYQVVRGHSAAPRENDVLIVLDDSLLLLPSVQPLTGRFQGRRFGWTPTEPAVTDPKRNVVLAFCLALMTAECLAMTGADRTVIVEGPIARNLYHPNMLAAATGLAVIAAATQTGTAIGAALLFTGDGAVSLAQNTAKVLACDTNLVRYAKDWRAAVQRHINSAPIV